MGDVAGASGNGRRLVQTCCASVWQGPSRGGAIHTVRDRVAQAIEPHDRAMATQGRHAVVNSIDATPGCLTPRLQWLWGMVSDTAVCSLRHPHRSTEACAALLDAWAGILVRDGDGVSRTWVQARHTGLAHLMRTARGVAARAPPDLAACGAWAMAALQRLGPLATAPPTGGEWRAWDARRCQWIDQ